jgi:hypothetical protein
MGQMYKCYPNSTHGALLYLPHGGHSENAYRTKVFKKYIKGNADSWLRWSREGGFLIDNMEDLILVTGCTLATSWAAAVFDNSEVSTPGSDSATISLDISNTDRGGAQFVWNNNCGNVYYNNSHGYLDPVSFPHYAPSPWN